ncbi:SANT/Myb_domain [Hexamita inflata]|uniref:SANT/Myb domain n=1 Tax=Hexamita inflata TaxID=28002 RepID=A0AA86V530_9EUKA|nr:SANT/Myb domain [Hexamita inflata]
MNQQKQQWRPEEINRLNLLTQSYKDNQREIDWRYISSQMGNRTELQCKQFYLNNQVQPAQNIPWNRIQLMMLFNLVISSKGNFELIQAEMPNFTITQLKTQWMQMQSESVLYTADFYNVQQDKQFVQQISMNVLMQEEYILRVKLYNIYEDFRTNINSDYLLSIYQQELERRNIKQPKQLQMQQQPKEETNIIVTTLGNSHLEPEQEYDQWIDFNDME